jgi:uncharacterized protein YdhG (YjbR/CyaY superfamily)
MTVKARTIDEFLASLSADKRTALEKLRRDIRNAAPNVEECISYGVPGFRLDGKLFLSFGAGAKHCAFYPGAHPVRTLERDLRGYSTSKGTIRFAPAEPLPTTLVRKIVKLRLSEHERRLAKR